MNSFRSHLLKKEWGFVSGSDGKESTCSAGDPGLIPVLGRSPGEGNGSPLQYSCLENPKASQRSLAGYSPWSRKESDPTEATDTHSPSMISRSWKILPRLNGCIAIYHTLCPYPRGLFPAGVHVVFQFLTFSK